VLAPVSVLVVSVSPDLAAELSAEAVARRPDMTLLKQRVLAASDVCVDESEFPMPFAIVVVGHEDEPRRLANDWLRERSDLIVVRVEIVGDALITPEL
jgi:hypothetical protein